MGERKREREGMKQVNWWLPSVLLGRLNEYRYEQRIESLTEAARRLLEDALSRWERRAKG